MRKVLYLFSLLGLFATAAKAQITVSHGAPPAPSGQTVNYSGTNVTVSRSGNTVNQSTCGVGPYVVGINNPSTYTFAFNAPVTHVIVTMTRIHVKDTIAFRVNGNPVTLSLSNLLPDASSCGLPAADVTNTGNLTSNVPQLPTSANGAGTQIVFTSPVAPFKVSTFEVESITGPASNGVAFSVAFLPNDTCNLPFDIVASDTTPCSGRCVTLQVPNFPNSTFTWGTDGTVLGAFPQTGAKMDTFYQRICPITILYKGQFWARAVRGSCTYEDTIYIDPKNTPAPPKIVRPLFPNGACRGADDSLDASTTLGGGGEYYWYRKNPSANIKGQPNPVYNNRWVNIPGFQPSDEGEYCVYAVSANDLCVTDTVCINAFMLPDVVADFDIINAIMSCKFDTVEIRNQSIGATNGYIWKIYDYYFDGTTNPHTILTVHGKNSQTFKEAYPIPQPNIDPRKRWYVIELVALNVACRDSVKDSINFLHPLTAGFKINDDNVCQGIDTVFFTDTTTLSVAGIHQYSWEFGEPGSPKSTNDVGIKWLYTKTGTWRAKLKVTDFLGCVDSAYKDIFVDSTGPLFFTSSDTVVCAGQQIQFRGDLNRVGLTESWWEFGNGLRMDDSSNTLFNYDIPGIYTISFNAKYRVCPEAKSEVKVRVKPFPRINVGPDTTMCQFGQPIRIWDRINDPLTKGLKWHWNTPSGRDSGSALVVRHPGVYSATVTMDGCSTTDSITVARNCYLDIPNAFTPDGDGNNDYFLPRQLMGRSISKFKMSIFNRWGQKVFETSSINGRGWDGNFNAEKQPSGVYVYQLEVGFSDNNMQLEKYEGNVTLLR